MISRNNEKTDVVILGNFITHGSNEVFLKKFLHILFPISRRVLVLSDWNYRPTNDKIEVINSVRLVTRKFSGNSSNSRIMRYFLVQLVFCSNMLKSAKRARIVFAFDVLMILPILLAKILRKRVVVFAASRFDMDSYESISLQKALLAGLFEFVKGTTFKIAYRIIVESKSLVNWLDLSKYDKKLCLGPTFVDTEVFRLETDVHSRENVVGYIGNLNESKGVMEFVKSISIVLDKCPEASFLIVGTGHCHEAIKNFLMGHGLSTKVALPGWIRNSEVAKNLNELKLLVLPSLSEGLPNIILESMACGTPVLATNVGGIPDVIEDDITGFILKDNSAESVAKGITKVLNQTNLVEISRNAQHLIERDYSYKAAICRYHRLLDSLVQDER